MVHVKDRKGMHLEVAEMMNRAGWPGDRILAAVRTGLTCGNEQVYMERLRERLVGFCHAYTLRPADDTRSATEKCDEVACDLRIRYVRPCLDGTYEGMRSALEPAAVHGAEDLLGAVTTGLLACNADEHLVASAAAVLDHLNAVHRSKVRKELMHLGISLDGLGGL